MADYRPVVDTVDRSELREEPLSDYRTDADLLENKVSSSPGEYANETNDGKPNDARPPTLVNQSQCVMHKPTLSSLLMAMNCKTSKSPTSVGLPLPEEDAIATSEVDVQSETSDLSWPTGESPDRAELEQFRQSAYQMVDYVIEYQRTLRSRPVMPGVEPGYMRSLIPSEAPEQPDSWQQVMADIDRVIMPGMAHWRSPQFHAYYPSGISNAALLADILSDALGCVGISWASAPACTELEVHMMDWLGKLLRLPAEFLFESGLGGGGVIQGSACETTFVTMLAARSCKVREILGDEDAAKENLAAAQHPRLVAFTSDQSHSSAARAGLLAGLRIRSLPTDANCCLRGDTLQRAIDDEIAHGNVPFYLLASLGTTASCAFDKLTELGPVCRQHGLWMHIDAAYAGAAFICPEFRPLMDGVEFAMSFNFNPHKFMLSALDCSTLWVRNSKKLTDVFQVDALFLKTAVYDMPNYRHWAIQLSRRFRALKLWFVMRLYGAQGIRAHIRRHASLAKQFETLVRDDDRFEVAAPVHLGLVCFRLKKYGNVINDHLLSRINGARRIHMVPAMLHGDVYVIRFVLCSEYAEPSDVEFAWSEIQRHAAELLGSTEVLSRAKMLWGSVRAASLGLRLFHNWNSV